MSASHRSLRGVVVTMLATTATAQDWSAVSPPYQRREHGMGFDPVSARLLLADPSGTWGLAGGDWAMQPTPGAPRGPVLFHGAVGRMLAIGWATMELTAAGWSQRAVHPSRRDQAAVAQDSARAVTVMFGGITSAGGNPTWLSDTWEYDGNVWSQVTVATSPPARTAAGMAFDAARARVVLFGGSGVTGLLADTWEYDGRTWTRVLTPNAPSARSACALAFDPLRNRIVLLGGRDTNGLSDTWEYDGVDWVRHPGANAPSSCWGHALAFDPQRGRIVASGGGDGPGMETWELGAAGWTRVGRWQSPGVRNLAELAYDAARSTVVLFGGDNVLPPYTWEYRAGGWQPKPTLVSPPARLMHAMAYDAFRRRTVMFGGVGGGRDTWEYDGVDWRRVVTATAPLELYGHRMVYDPFRRRVVLFGGQYSRRLSDTWEYDGSDWRLLPTMGAPGPRDRHDMTFDAARGVVVLFGGVPENWNGAYHDDTWELDGTTWRRIVTPQSPPPLYDVSLAFDAPRGRVVLFGGVPGMSRTTWEYDGATWRPLTIPVAPLPRQGQRMVYDAGRDRVVMHGGLASAAYAETWELAPQPSAVWTRFGPACGVTTGAPDLRAQGGGGPARGTTFVLELQGLAPATIASLLVLGLGVDTWFGLPVPADLSASGIACATWVPGNVLVGMVQSGTSATCPLPIPNAPELAGRRIHGHAVTLMAGGLGALSNGGVGRID